MGTENDRSTTGKSQIISQFFFRDIYFRFLNWSFEADVVGRAATEGSGPIHTPLFSENALRGYPP